MAYWRLMATSIPINIGSDNGSLPEGTKPLPEAILTYHQYGPVAFTRGQFHWIWSSYQITEFCMRIKYLKWQPHLPGDNELTHWGQVTHICVSKITIIGSDNGLLPGCRQAIIWTNAGILLTGPLVINLSEIVIKIHTFSFKEMYLKMSSGKWRPFCLGLHVLKWFSNPIPEL